MRARLAARLPDPSDDRGSLAMALLVVIVGALLGALMLPMMLTQAQSTRFDTTRVQSLNAAQAGVDVVLGQIRASTTTDAQGNTWGNAATLPCITQSNPLTGAVASAGGAQYAVWLTYYASDPTVAGATPMNCVSGYGTYDPGTKTATPRYAVINSTGSDGTAVNGTSRGRTIITTYVFQTDDTDVPGGEIELFPSSSTPYCMDAGLAVPVVGAVVRLKQCSTTTPAAAQQVFAYRSDLSIQLVSSVTSSNPTGLCLDTSPTTHATSGVAMVLNKCAVADPAKCATITACSPWNQQWSIDDNAHLEGARSDQTDIDGFCVDAPLQVSGTPLVLASCAGGTTDTAQTWVPAPTAGAGMAGASNSQLVNYAHFANCLDVTGQDPTSPYLILYTCKQNPNPGKVAWNQKFTPAPALAVGPTKVLLKTVANGTTYCLTSPLSNGGYVKVTTPCPASPIGAYAWTVSQAEDGQGNDLPYSQKYTIVDSGGYCLGPGPTTDLLNGQYLKAVVTPCSGSTAQKWNASASLDASRLIDTHERPAGS